MRDPSYWYTYEPAIEARMTIPESPVLLRPFASESYCTSEASTSKCSEPDATAAKFIVLYVCLTIMILVLIGIVWIYHYRR